MTPDYYSSTTHKGAVDTSRPKDEYQLRDGASFSFDFEGLEDVSRKDCVLPYRASKRSGHFRRRSRGRLAVAILFFLVIGGGCLAYYLYPKPVECTAGAPSGIASIINALLGPTEDSPTVGADSWAGVAGGADQPLTGLSAAPRKGAPPAQATCNSCDVSGCLTQVSEQLQLVESQYDGCKVALDLMSKEKSVFSGFVPELADTGLSSHTAFQAKIAELEIKRKSLLTRFVPQSREVRAVDEEITAVRESFKEYLTAHIAYLNKRKSYLTTRKAELERGPSPTARVRNSRVMGPTAGNRPRMVPAVNPSGILKTKEPPATKSLEKLGQRVPASAMERIIAAVKPSFEGFPFTCAISGSTEEDRDISRTSERQVWAPASSLIPPGSQERPAWGRLSRAVGLTWD